MTKTMSLTAQKGTWVYLFIFTDAFLSDFSADVEQRIVSCVHAA
jgi:hypothetical protein